MDYNLLVEPWIPVLRTNGKTDRVGIRAALTEAGRIRQIAASNPMDNVALLRLMLAVLQWCKPEPSSEELLALRCREAIGIPPTWFKKLGSAEQPNSAFDLLSEAGGFYQDYAATGVMVAAMNLFHDLPSGSQNCAFSAHARWPGRNLSFLLCSWELVRWPSVASAGTAGAGQSMTASINGNTPAYFVRTGANLLATLMFTWPCGQLPEGDATVWDGANEESPLGFLKGVTWRSRYRLPRSARC